VRLLADRARSAGDDDDARSLKGAWTEIAESVGIAEEYFGFYDYSSLNPLQATINDMLTEASPRVFQKREAEPLQLDAIPTSPVHLLNLAWQRFQEVPNNYPQWEQRAVDVFLEADTPI
jgi:hypothetical protein